MNAELLHQSDYIKAVDFGGKDVTVEIQEVNLEVLEDTKGVKKKKGTISLVRPADKKWVLNVTNLRCLIAMFGKETDDWIGKRVTLFPAPNDKSESGFAIRIRGSQDLSADVKFSSKIGRDGVKSFHLISYKGATRPAAQTRPAAPPQRGNEPTEEEKAEILAAEAEEARRG